MSLEYAILGLLSAGPQHGYTIGKKLNLVLGAIWPVNPGQVYATLDRLARDGAIASAPPAPPEHRARILAAVGRGRRTRAASVRPFVLLPAGRRALRHWLLRPIGCALPPDPLAAHLALRVWAGDTAGIARLLAARRRRYASLRGCLSRADHDAPCVRAARQHLEVELDWLALVERVLVGAQPSRTMPLLD
jgi:hypothetical protein